MKTMKMALVALSLVAACLIHADGPPKIAVPDFKIGFRASQPVAPASSWSGSAYYDVRSKHASAVVFNRIGELTIHGKPTGIEANGFVGAQDSKGTPATIGLAILWHRQVFDQIAIVFGVGGSMTGGRWGGGPILGASIQF